MDEKLYKVDYPEIGFKLRDIRESKGISLRSVANSICQSASDVKRIESGTMPLGPYWNTVVLYLERLGFDLYLKKHE